MSAKRTRTLIAWIHGALIAMKTCNETWNDTYEARVSNLLHEHLPHGSGIDGNHKSADDMETLPRFLRFTDSFHRMDEHGYYAGWFDYVVTVMPSFEGIDVDVTFDQDDDLEEFDRESLEEMLHEQYTTAFTTNVTLEA